jgi:FkbM family methyltransferase
MIGVGMAQGRETAMAAPETAMSPQQAALTAALQQKHELELAMAASPADDALRSGYCDQLQRLATATTGLGTAVLPEIAQPLYFRAATPDVANLLQVFQDRLLDVPLAAPPRRLLLLGAYAGYSAVWLAHRYPSAEIACVEPMPANLRLLTLNTAPWPRIRVLGNAVWHSPVRLGVVARLAGDWAPSLGDRVDDDERPLPAYPVESLLASLGWPGADFLLCDIVGSEVAVFADPLAPWLRHLDTALVLPYPGLAAGSESLLATCFPPAFFEHGKRGDYALFQRRTPLYAAPPPPPPLPLFSDALGLAPLLLEGLEPAPWAFFVFGSNNCQLHPNQPGLPPARAAFPRELTGQTQFVTTLQHAGNGGAPIVFTCTLEDASGSALLRAEQTLAAHEQHVWTLPLPAALHGPHRLVLQTAMAAGAGNNNNAWARWLNPTFR